MIRAWVPRRILAVALSAGSNAALVASLAGLDAPPEREDPHEPHRVRPQLVEPPPPPLPPRSAAQASAPSPAALPEPPAAPPIDLPAGPGLEGALALGGLDGLGSLGLDGPALDAPPSAASGPAGPDAPPRLAAPPDLARFYPASARRRELEGRTLVEVAVDPSGAVVDARVLRAEPPGVFDEAALRAARSLRFQPAERGGVPVAGRTRLELEWRTRN